MINESTWIERCPKCQVLFVVEERGGGGRVRSHKPVDCPCCSHIVKGRTTSGVFLTRVLGDEEIEEYESLTRRKTERPRY